MSSYPLQPLTLGAIQTYPLSARKSKVSIRDFAKPPAKNPSLARFLDSLPNILVAEDLRHLLVAIHRAALIHDFEIALVGNTSEDVDAGLRAGQFGMAEETGKYLNEIAKLAQRIRTGYGEAAGQFLTSDILNTKFSDFSVLIAAYKHRVPVTVHLAIGTDIPHMHPAVDGAALGSATHYDFRLFCALVRQMHPGGVYLNWGSAVLLPEVFLKAVSVVRNHGVPLRPITTANFDFIQHYRPLQNVVKRPTAPARGRRGPESHGYAITGHHELLMPLVAAALAAGWPRKS